MTGSHGNGYIYHWFHHWLPLIRPIKTFISEGGVQVLGGWLIHGQIIYLHLVEILSNM